jgi:hypothetical protein
MGDESMNKRNKGRKGCDLSIAGSLIMTILNTSIIIIVMMGRMEVELSH